MRDFTFYNPTRIEFSKGKEANIGQYAAEYGVTKVLLVYGSERIKTNGLFDTVTASLSSQGIEIETLGGVVSNPLLSKANEGINLAKKTQVDAIIAVGGGSVLDTSKTISAGVKYDGDVWDFFSGVATPKEALPVFSVLTLAATGSEMNPLCVVTNDETKAKYSAMSPVLYPKVSIVNPELMATVSNDYLAYSASDIFSHCLDLYFSADYLPDYNKYLIESILKTVISTTDILLKDGEDYEARGEFAWAATMALNLMTLVGVEGNTFDTHLIEHPISSLHNVAHGAGLSVVMPAWMKWYKNNNLAQFERFAKEVFNVEGADNGIEALENWYQRIGTPTKLSELDIPRTAIPAIAENAYAMALQVGMSYTQEDIIEVLELT